jgi:universal stress protein E
MLAGAHKHKPQRRAAKIWANLWVGGSVSLGNMFRPPNRLLAGLGPAHDGDCVVDRAGEIARRFDAELVLFESVYNQYVSPHYFPRHSALEQARSALVRNHVDRIERKGEALERAGIKVTIDAAWDTPWDEGVIRGALRHQADWIIAGVRSHPVHRRRLFADADWQLIRHAPCPLLLVRRASWEAPPRVIAAVDPLHGHGKPQYLDNRIVDIGACICRCDGGRLYVFHAFQAIVSDIRADDPDPAPIEYTEASLEGAHNAAVETLVAGLTQVGHSVRVAEGKTEEKLPEFASEISADLVVMGAVARNAVRRIFIGSTAEKVLDRLDCDILIVKPAGFESPVKLVEEALLAAV